MSTSLMPSCRPCPICSRLVFGPPSGQIQPCLDKAAQINKKHGPFDALFILGDLFAPRDAPHRDDKRERELLEGTLKCESLVVAYTTFECDVMPREA